MSDFEKAVTLAKLVKTFDVDDSMLSVLLSQIGDDQIKKELSKN